MKNSYIPEYLKDLSCEERALICKYRIMSEEEKHRFSEQLDKYLQSNAKTDNK